MHAEQQTRPLGPRTLSGGRILVASGMRAGPWVFVTGLLPHELGDTSRPRSGQPPWLIQARSVWQQAETILGEGSSDLSRIVRCDQFFSDWRAVPFFHQARREACGAYIAPSTSVLQPETLLPGADMMTDMIAVASDGPNVESIVPDGLDLPATSSFVPVVRAGSMVFVAGFLAASGVGDLDGVAAEAKVPEGHLWKGNRITLETNYIIKRKLVPALAGAGLELSHTVKADVFLRDIDDVPAFNQVWLSAFNGSPPATTITPTSNPGFAIEDSRIEINLVASAALAQRVVDPSVTGSVCDKYPAAVRIGDFIIFSGLVAADAQGLIPSARIPTRDRYIASSIEAQMDYLIDVAETVCRAAGADLRNVARIVQVHTDLADVLPALSVWQRRLPGIALPFSAARVPGPLIVPDCSVQIDLWVYAPQ